MNADLDAQSGTVSAGSGAIGGYLPHDADQWFQLMADKSPVLIWVTDEEGKIVFGNEACTLFFGVSPKQISESDSWADYIHPDDYDRYASAYLAAQTENREFSCGVRVRRFDGQWRHLETHASPYTRNGRFSGFVASSPDVTAHIELERRMAEEDIATSRFIATLSHELRNPLAPISNSLQVLKQWQPPLEPVPRKMVDVIARQLDHVVKLVNDLSDAQRIRTGKVDLIVEWVDLKEVITSALEACEPNTEKRRQSVELKLPPGPVLIQGDELRLWQVFSNLIGNASKFTPDGKCISVEAAIVGGWAMVIVADEGIGIAREDLGRIFEIFTQVKRGITSHKGGLGLGLAIAKGFVEMHGGSIEARSLGSGKGSQMVVRLPLSSARAPAHH